MRIVIPRYSNAILLPRHQRQSRFVGSVLHSHADIDLPPTSADLRLLFHNLLSIDLSPSIFVVTTGKKYVIFRGLNTPLWNEEFVSEKIESWITQFSERVKQFQSQVNSQEENIVLHRRVSQALLSQITAKYDLKMFSGPSNQNIVNRQL